MEKIAFLDVEKITEEHVQFLHAWGGKKVVVSKGVDLSPLNSLALDIREYDSVRSQTFLNESIQVYDSFMQSLEKNSPLASKHLILTNWRYLFPSLSELHYRLWIVGKIESDFGASELIWLSFLGLPSKTFSTPSGSRIRVHASAPEKKTGFFRSLLLSIQIPLSSSHRHRISTPQNAFPKLIFIEQHRNHAEMSMRLINFLSKKTDFDFQPLFLTANQKLRSEAEKMVPTACGLYERLSWRQRLRVGSQMLMLLRSIDRLLRRSEFYPHSNLKNFLLDLMRWHCMRTFTLSALCLEAAKSWLDSEDVRAVISSSGGGFFSRAFFSVARDRKIPSFVIQHGNITFDRSSSHWINDYHFVWGDKFKEQFVNARYEASKIFVTGSLRLPFAPTDARPDQLTKLLYLPSRTGGSFVSYATGKKMLRAVEKLCSEFDDISITIKPHPKDSSDIFTYLDEFPRIKILRNSSVIDEIHQCDLAIASLSTACLEVCAQQKFLLFLGMDNIQPLPEIVEFGCFLPATTGEELISVFRKLKSQESLRQSQWNKLQRFRLSYFGEQSSTEQNYLIALQEGIRRGSQAIPAQPVDQWKNWRIAER